MDMHRLNHRQLLKGVSLSFQRYLSRQIKWDKKLIGIFGTRGVGKTTLVLQHIKSTFGDSATALYLSLDNIWFQEGVLYKTGKQFQEQGGTHLFLDNVHRYEGWIQEVRKLYRSCSNLHIVFIAPQLLPVSKIQRSLGDDLAAYTLNTLSFREYLSYEGAMDLKPYSLDDILANHVEITERVMEEINVVPIFRNYLDHGCYPFYWEDPDAYFFRLQDLMRDSVDIDLPALFPTDYKMLTKIKQLMLMLAESAPLMPRVPELAKELELENAHVQKLIEYTEAIGELHLLESKEGESQERLRKLYLGNTNLLFGLFLEADRIYTGETFFVDQMSNIAPIELLPNNDFLVDGKYTFMTGDPLMDYDRIKDTANAFAAVYGQPKSSGKKIPIWALGLCY